MVKYFVFIVFIFFFLGAYSQNILTTRSKKAQKHYYKALRYYRQRDAKDAIIEIEKCAKHDSLFVELWLLRGDIQHLLRDTMGEINSFKKAIYISPVFFPNVHFNLAELFFAKKYYKYAIDSYNNFLKYSYVDNNKRNKAEIAIRNCEYIMEKTEDYGSVDFFPLSSVNSDDDEYWPFVSASGEEFYFTRKIGKGKYENEDLFKAVKGGLNNNLNLITENDLKNNKDDALKKYTDENLKGGVNRGILDESDLGKKNQTRSEVLWKNLTSLPFNTSANEGNITMTADGKYIYFSACDRSDSYGRFDIYFSSRCENGWTKPINIGFPVNTEAWESQPSISSDGKTLYFASNRKGGKGKSDIWESRLLYTLKDGRQIWSEPVSLSFNTADDDMAPFVYFDNSSLFFSTKGLPGMGGYDVYKVEMENGKWGCPVNIGVNNRYDNIGIAVSPDGSTVYFSSVTKKGDRDIFYYYLPEPVEVRPICYIYGGIYDANTGKNVCAEIKVCKYSCFEEFNGIYDVVVCGNYSLCLPCKDVFCLNVIAKGYQFYSEKIDLSDSVFYSRNRKDILLHPICINSEVNLSNIYFDFDSFNLREDSFFELFRLKEYLELNDNIKIEIGGHTDNVGIEEYNMELSFKRAREVYLFLINRGISEDRLQYKGYGSSRPVDDNDTGEARKMNRRTEVRIVRVD